MQELLLLSPKPSATRNEDSLLWWQLQTLVQGRCTSVDDARTTNSISSTTTVVSEGDNYEVMAIIKLVDSLLCQSAQCGLWPHIKCDAIAGHHNYWSPENTNAILGEREHQFNLGRES